MTGLQSDLNRHVDQVAAQTRRLCETCPACAERDALRAAAPRWTAREVEVIRLAAEGLTTAQIARRLHIEATTVKAHLVHAAERCGVRGRVAVVVTALRTGVIR